MKVLILFSLAVPLTGSTAFQSGSRLSLASRLAVRPTTIDISRRRYISSATSLKSSSEALFEGPGLGIRRDYKMRLPYFKSDIKDGLNIQCLATSLFLFFGCLAPAVGFGGLYAAATDGAIGTVEMVASTAGCGVVYALAAAQPITIIGGTGPVLAFVACLAQLAKLWQLPFLPLYAWTGLWSALILLICSMTSASNLVKVSTRSLFALIEHELAYRSN